MKIAFVLLDETWNGGVQYLVSLLSALHELPGRPVSALLLAGPELSASTLDRLRPFLEDEPLRCGPAVLRDARRPLRPLLQGRAEELERVLKSHRADLIFHHQLVLGSRFSIPSLGWIPDFQHRHLPRMFGPARALRRELFFQLLVDGSTRLMVSSRASQKDCETFYARSRGRVAAVPFAIRPGDPALLPRGEELRARYGLPERFFFMPNQVWRHKNHLAVVEAMASMDDPPAIVATGSLKDHRDPGHPGKVQSLIRERGLEARFRMLGQVPYEDVQGLLLASDGLVNPSLFEGWSTPVEEAKGYGIPMVLSDLAVHREQAQDRAQYFDPGAPAAIAKALQAAWRLAPSAPKALGRAIQDYQVQRRRFAERFLELAGQCVEDRE